MSWWRRNRWGLIALIPAIVAVLAVNYSQAHDHYWARKPRVAVAPDASGWAEYSGAKMRLVELAEATDVKDYGGKPVQIAGGVRIWRAVVEFRHPASVEITGCSFGLEDDQGRVYSEDPWELGDAKIELFATCAPDKDKVPDPSAGFRVEVFFVTAPGARAVAVRIQRPTSLPQYARLTLNG